MKLASLAGIDWNFPTVQRYTAETKERAFPDLGRGNGGNSTTTARESLLHSAGTYERWCKNGIIRTKKETSANFGGSYKV